MPINSDFPVEFLSGGNVITEINNKFNVNSETKELCSTDLDGDGESEYIALVMDEKKDFFAKCLLDSNYNIISYLTVFNEKYKDFTSLVTGYNLLDSGEIIDINNDGIMEILVDLPIYEGFSYKVFTYKNGEFDGDFINKCSLKP